MKIPVLIPIYFLRSTDNMKLIGSLGNNFMERFALVAPTSVVKFAGHLLFWPIACSQHVLYRLGLFPWYSEITRTPSGGRLLLGGLPWPAIMRHQLTEKERVSSVVNLVSEKPVFWEPERKIKEFKVPMTDFVHPDIEEVQSAVKYIDNELQEGRTVYIHCRAGKGRSATVVMCWLIAHMGMSPEAAQEFLLRKRPQVLDNLKDRDVVKQFFKIDTGNRNS